MTALLIVTVIIGVVEVSILVIEKFVLPLTHLRFAQGELHA